MIKDNLQKDEDIGKLNQIVENFKKMFEDLNIQVKYNYFHFNNNLFAQRNNQY